MRSIRALRAPLASACAAAAFTSLAAVPAAAAASDDNVTVQSTGTGQGTVKVAPYVKRAKPTHRVSLTDGRVFFVKSLEETESGYVLHTLEDEDIEVDGSEVEEIVKLGAD